MLEEGRCVLTLVNKESVGRGQGFHRSLHIMGFQTVVTKVLMPPLQV